MHSSVWLIAFLMLWFLPLFARAFSGRRPAVPGNNVAGGYPGGTVSQAVTKIPEANLKEELRTSLRSARLKEQNLFRLEAAPLEELGREFDEIRQMSRVLDVQTSGTTLVVTTDVLYCLHPRTQRYHEIGAFTIHIATDGSQQIWWINNTQVLGGYHSPHVNSGDGRACLGNAVYPLRDAFNRRQFANVVQLAIQFVESVTNNSNYTSILERWPVTGRTPQSNSGTKAGVNEEQYKQSRDRYIQFCSQRTQELLSQASADTMAQQQQLVQLEGAFFQHKRAEYLKERGLSAELTAEDLEPELQGLREVSQVREVRVSDGKVLVSTEMLTATMAGVEESYELGEFLIELPLTGLWGGVRWLNNTRRVDAMRPGMNAPYVYADGAACADEMRETFIELVAQFELAMAGELAIQFVQTINDDQMGKHINKWPVATTMKGVC